MYNQRGEFIALIHFLGKIGARSDETGTSFRQYEGIVVLASQFCFAVPRRAYYEIEENDEHR